MKLPTFPRYLSVQAINLHKEVAVIAVIIQQKIHETHKIWHPSKRNYLSVPFLRDRNNSRACGKNLEIPEGMAGHTANPFPGGCYSYFLELHISLQFNLTFNI